MESTALTVASGVRATNPSASFLDRFLGGEFDRLFAHPSSDPSAGFERRPVDDPDALADALAAQARRRGDHAKQLEAIGRLRDPAARTVVTGQQAGLLLGPLFTLSKAVTALRLAERADRPERPVVAVFWIASQDHDAAEIDHAWLLDPEERLHRPALPFPRDLPSGRVPWRPAWTDRLLDDVARAYGETPQAREARERIARACADGGTVADVFARTLSSLLGADGLIVLDPMQPEVAALCAPLLRRELDDPSAGPAAIRTAGEALRALGIRPQLGRADDATNLFVQEAGGPRRLLRYDGTAFHPDGRPERRLSAEELASWLDDDPAALTPAAGLRPTVQDAILPTAQFVVGPGELRYVAQLRDVYRHHLVPMPSVVPRAHLTLLEPPAARILAQHELDPDRYVTDPDAALRERLLRMAGHADRFDALTDELDAGARALLAEVEGIDPTLEGPVRRGRASIETALRRLRTKAGDALARRDATTTRQFERLSAHLLPDGRPQERVLSPFSFFAKFGVDPVMARISALEPEGRQTLTIDP